MLSNSAVGTYTYPTQGSSAVRPHAVDTAGSWTFAYDANGNQTSRLTSLVTDRTIDYDADNRPTLVAANGNTTSYLYGPDGARLKKVVGSSVTLYLGDAIERDPSGAFTNYLNPDVKRAVGVLHFLHRDHLALFGMSNRILARRWGSSRTQGRPRSPRPSQPPAMSRRLLR